MIKAEKNQQKREGKVFYVIVGTTFLQLTVMDVLLLDAAAAVANVSDK